MLKRLFLVIGLIFVNGSLLAMEPKQGPVQKSRKQKQRNPVQQIQRQILNESEQRELWDIYIQFLENHNEKIVELYSKNAKAWANNEFISLRTEDLQNWDYQLIGHQIAQLTIELPFDQIKTIFKEKGVIQLRPASTASKLLLGCGNSPIVSALQNYYPEMFKFHTHQEYITINPDIFMNPTIVAYFGTDNLEAILPKNHFNEIATELLAYLKYNLTLVEQIKSIIKPPFRAVEISDDRTLYFAKKKNTISFEYNLIPKPSQYNDLAYAIYFLTAFQKSDSESQYFNIDTNLTSFSKIIAGQSFNAFFTINIDDKLKRFIEAVNYFNKYGSNKFIEAYDIGNDGLFQKRSGSKSE